MICKKCGETLPAKRIICPQCGTRTTLSETQSPTPITPTEVNSQKTCEKCGESLPERRRICTNCGSRNFTSRITEPKTQSAPSTPSTEIKSLKICKKCGESLPERRRICPNCGTRYLSQVTQETSLTKDVSARNVANTTDSPKTETKTLGNADEISVKKETLCKNCNNPLTKGNTFCGFCEEKVKTPPEKNQEAPSKPPYQPKQSQQESIEEDSTGNVANTTDSPKTETKTSGNADEISVKKETLCKNCNNPLVNGPSFCGFCGEKVETPPEKNQEAPSKPHYQPKQSQQESIEDDLAPPFVERTPQSSTQTNFRQKERLQPPVQTPTPKFPLGKIIACGSAILGLLLVCFFFLLGNETPESPQVLETPQVSEIQTEQISEQNIPSTQEEEKEPQSSSSQINTSLPTYDEIMQLYVEKLYEYQDASEKSWDMEDHYQNNLTPMMPYYGPEYCEVAFADFDDNGIIEMIIAGDENRILSVYTLSSESGAYKAKLLISSHFTVGLSIGNGMDIAFTEAGAFESNTTIYRVEGDSVVALEGSLPLEWFPDFFDFSPLLNYLSDSTDFSEIDKSTSQYSNNPISENYSYYHDTLTMIGRAVENAYNFDELRKHDLCLLISYAGWSTGYTFLDIDRDGIDELIIGNAEDSTIFAIYRVKNQDIELLFNAGERSQYYLCTDKLLFHTWSNSAFDSGKDTYELTKTGLVKVTGLGEKDFDYNEWILEFTPIGYFYL